MSAATTRLEAETPGGNSLRPFRMGLAFGFFNAMTWQVALGTPLVLLAQALGATAFQVGLMYSFLFLMTPVQVFSTALLPKFGYKRMMLFGWGTRAFCLLAPIYLALLAPVEPEPWHARLLIASIFLFALLRATGNCAFIPWMYSILPDKIRGRYFAVEQIYSGVSGVGTLLFCSFMFWVAPLFQAFVWQYAVALLGALLSWYALARLRDGPRPEAMDLNMVLREGPAICLRPGPYRRFLVLSVAFAVTSAPLPAFAAYYLRVERGLDPSTIIIFTTLQYLGAISGALFTRNIIDRAGPRVFFALALVLYSIVAFAWWSFLRTGTELVMLLLGVYFLHGVAASTWMSANLNYLPRLCTERDRPLRVSVHGATTALLAGLSPILLGRILQADSGGAAINATAFQGYFLFVIAMQLILLSNVPRLEAAKGESEPIVLIGAIGRPIRSLGFLINLVGYPARANRNSETDNRANE